jgi:ATP-dependent DNA helicase RecG
MTATPIPRTLSMTLYGDLEVSVIDELPVGRKPIRTILRDEEQGGAVHEFVREEVRQGRQAYFVYPLIEESESVDLKAATSHYNHLQQDVFPDLTVGLLHGRMTSEEKDGVMSRFKNGELQILVATTVIEVGIDVPNASVMVIEDAERFGLSQLHQLRGRVGRGAEQSYCILVTKRWIAAGSKRLSKSPSLSVEDRQAAQRRLAAMVETTDGFTIAELDLSLRGPGDYFGTRQSGVPEFRIADLLNDGVLLEQSRSDAFALIDRDPDLTESSHRPLADLLRAIHPSSASLLDAG